MRKKKNSTKKKFVAATLWDVVHRIDDVGAGLGHVLGEIRDGQKGHVDLKGSSEAFKQELFQQQLAIQQATLSAIRELVESQKKLSETILLLTARGVEKSRRQAGAVKDFSAEASAQGRDLAAAQAAGQLATSSGTAEQGSPLPEKVVEEKKGPDLKVVPEPEEQKPPSKEDVQRLFLDYHARHGRPASVALLKSYGAEKVSEVPPAQFLRFAAECQK